MLTLAQIRMYLRDCSPTKVGQQTGLTPMTIIRIRDGVTNNPDEKTRLALSAHIESVTPVDGRG